MRKLHLSETLTIPIDAVTQTFAILAKRGVGKTYLALVMVEEMLKAALHVVVVDPVGVCWGLRAAADGKSAGLPILVLGGEHGDVPLEVAAGETIADFIIDERQSAVLDLSLFRKGEQVRFMTDFAERLYHRNRQPLMVVLDEADAFAPQRPQHGQERMLGAIEDLVRRGRARGLGVTLVTQRAAVLNKDVLTQVEVLVALRTIAPQDRDAIDAWVRVHGTPEQREQLMASLPSLPIGTAWFWSPGWLDIFQQVHVRRRETFDSSATPKAGAKVAAPKQLAAVDLDVLKARIQSTIERAKENDPQELKRQIAALKKQLAAKQAPGPVAAAKAVPPERIEVPVITEQQLARLEAALAKIHALDDHLSTTVGILGKTLGSAYGELAGAIRLARQPAPAGRAVPVRTAPKRSPGEGLPRAQPIKQASDVGERSPGERLSPSQQRILDALAWLEGAGLASADKVQVALFVGASPKSSTYGNNLGALRSAGLLHYPSPGALGLTDDGRARAAAADLPTSTAELQAAVLQRLPPSKAKILKFLLEIYPDSTTKEQLAEGVGASPSSSTFGNNLGSLRSLGMIEYPQPGLASATSLLFLEER